MTAVSSGERRSKLVGDIAGVFGTRLLLFPLGIAASVIVARALAPAGKGVYSTVLTIVDLSLLVGALGVAKSATYFIARGEERAEVRRATFLLSLGNGVLLSIVLVAVALLVLPDLFAGVPVEALLFAAPMGLWALLRAGWEGLLRGEQRNHAVNVIALASSGLFLAAVGALALAGSLRPELAVTVRVLSVAAAALLALVLLGWRLSGVAFARPRRAVTRTLLLYGVPFAVIGLAQNMSYRFDLLLVQGFMGNDEVGYYSIAGSTGELLWYLPTAVGFVLFPMVAASSKREAARQTAALVRWTLLLTAVAAGLVGLLAGPLVLLLYGSAYLPGVGALRLLLPGIVANVWYQVLSGYLMGCGRLRPLMMATGAGLVLNIGLNLLLIPRLGIEGAALASTVSYTAVGILVLRHFSTVAGVPRSQLLTPSLGELRAIPRRIASNLAASRAGTRGARALASEGRSVP